MHGSCCEHQPRIDDERRTNPAALACAGDRSMAPLRIAPAELASGTSRSLIGSSPQVVKALLRESSSHVAPRNPYRPIPSDKAPACSGRAPTRGGQRLDVTHDSPDCRCVLRLAHWAQRPAVGSTWRWRFGGYVPSSPKSGRGQCIGVGIALGAAIGAGISMAFGNLGLGMGPGIAIGAAMSHRNRPSGRSKQSRDQRGTGL